MQPRHCTATSIVTRNNNKKLLALALVTMSCSARSIKTSTTSTAATKATVRQTPLCSQSRAAVLDAMVASRADHVCTESSECRVVTGPGHRDPEYAEVVFASDANTLETRARDHLARCGAFYHHEAIDAYRVIAAACVEGRCAASVKTMHIEPEP
jgi:hypothetical protein